MWNWVSMGFLINLDLWCNLIFVCRIQCFIPFCSVRQKFSFFSGFNDLYHSTLFCFCAELSKLNHSALFCFFFQSADLDKSFSFSSGSSDLYHSALWDKSFSFFCRIQWLVPYCFIRQNLFFLWQVPFVHSFLFSFLHVVLSDYEDLCFTITFCLPAFDKLVEQHINLIQYSTSLLWNCFFYNIY